ncbi:MAG: hypothetical protein SWZ49_04670 [Cyanobacteriota bacterium]|nr:hypothetical protein [Cyanobacteriota bacterium]
MLFNSRRLKPQSLPEESSSGRLCAHVAVPPWSKDTRFPCSRRFLDEV